MVFVKGLTIDLCESGIDAADSNGGPLAAVRRLARAALRGRE